MSVCTCPVGTALPAVPNSSCPQDFGQIQKIAFQRVFTSGTTKNSFTTAAAIELLASWTAKLTANNGTKIVLSPYVEAPASDGGDAITFGGGNDTPGGIVKTIGRNPVTMTFELRQMIQNIISALKSLSCENVGVFFFNGDGQIMALKDESVATTFYPIPIKNLFVSDLKLNGLDTPDSNTLSFSFEPNWSDNVAIVTPTDFNPLTDIANS